MDQLAQDVRYAVRQLARHPGFAAVLALTLALAIGANTAVFSVVHGVLLRPLPYPDQDRLMMVWTQFPSMELLEFPASGPEYFEYRDQNRSFEHLAAYNPGAHTLTGDQDPERVQGVFTTWELFPALGVDALVGRTFGAEEDVPDAPVVLLSQGLWERRYGADASIVGRDILVNGQPRTVLGVLPAHVRFPTPDTELWLPMGLDPADPGGRGSHFLTLMGKLRPGVTHASAATELEALQARWAADPANQHEWNGAGHPAVLEPLTDEIVGDVRRSLLVLMGAVGVVLLIACANVANLLLVRGEGRQRELSVRSAIGAGRARIVRQLVTESVIMAAVGGLAGLALGWVGVGALRAVA
ncbi:MAG: ABC transporter permease, partial [Gemmatimonadetes bacterium]|nr:ABC transporter permease [Gemmatimonadota bacterium]